MNKTDGYQLKAVDLGANRIGSPPFEANLVGLCPKSLDYGQYRPQVNCGLIDQVHSSGLNDRFNPLEWVFCGSPQLIRGRNN
jgi:hypothetical protein